jgi:predicted unusual protein kinase regulating ubiquinone biosynthesis (AarF/ABC1/UbiB family)
MIFRDGLFHADPHPGNLLVRPDGGLIFLDFGAVGHLTPAMKADIPELLEAILRRDREGILRSLKRLGFVQRHPQDDVAQRVLDAFFARFLEDLEIESWNLQDIHVDARMKFEMMADFRRLDILLRDVTATFRVPREWILLFRTLILLTGVCTQLHPELRPVSVVRPYLEEFVLGKDRDWLKLVRTVVQDLALTAATLPGDLKKVLAQAQRGELAVEVQGLREGAHLLYALGHQLLYAAFTLGTGALAYLAQRRGDATLSEVLAGACGLSLLCLSVSLLRARKWSRRLRPRQRSR